MKQVKLCRSIEELMLLEKTKDTEGLELIQIPYIEYCNKALLLRVVLFF